MYVISNQQRDEIVKLLAEIKTIPGSDDKTLNNKRRANVIIKKLANAEQVSYEKNKKKTL